MDIQNVIADFKQISHVDHVHAFALRYGLQNVKDMSVSTMLLGDYRGKIKNLDVQMSHSWYDRCKTFSIQPDGNTVTLEIEGMQPLHVKFIDDH